MATNVKVSSTRANGVTVQTTSVAVAPSAQAVAIQVGGTQQVNVTARATSNSLRAVVK
jgi:hypothetical protein